MEHNGNSKIIYKYIDLDEDIVYDSQEKLLKRFSGNCVLRCLSLPPYTIIAASKRSITLENIKHKFYIHNRKYNVGNK